jgi:hypothetical protein
MAVKTVSSFVVVGLVMVCKEAVGDAAVLNEAAVDGVAGRRRLCCR